MALTAVERSERAKEAAAARWGAKESRMQKWHDLPLEDAMTQYAELRVEVEEIGRILAQRQPRAENEKGGYNCFECGRDMVKVIYSEPHKDPATGIFSNRFICSAICHSKMMVKKMGGVIKS